MRKRAANIPVGEIVVCDTRIVEPRTGCTIARGFPTPLHAVTAAKAMNGVADWFGILKRRAEGGKTNCQGELARIAEEHGGTLADGGNPRVQGICAQVVQAAEREGVA